MRVHDGEEGPASRAAAAEVKPEPMDAQQQHSPTDGHAALAQAWPIYRPRPVHHPFRAEPCSGSNLTLGYGHAGYNSR
jgi:heat shock transcription factor